MLTDVGSVKSEIHTEIKKAGLEGQFIGGHPMAGSDRIGFINSKVQAEAAGIKPKFFAKLHPKHKTPINALILIGSLTMLAPFAGRKMLVWIDVYKRQILNLCLSRYIQRQIRTHRCPYVFLNGQK